MGLQLKYGGRSADPALSGGSQGSTTSLPAPAFSAPGSFLSPHAQICALFTACSQEADPSHCSPGQGLCCSWICLSRAGARGCLHTASSGAIIPGDLSPSPFLLQLPKGWTCSLPALPITPYPLPRDSPHLCSSFAQTLNECLIQPVLQVAQGQPGPQRPGDAFPALSLVSPSPDSISSLSANLTSPLSDVSSLHW